MLDDYAALIDAGRVSVIEDDAGAAGPSAARHPQSHILLRCATYATLAA
jgi:hypothetical protein